jgi:hypothetical protein
MVIIRPGEKLSGSDLTSAADCKFGHFLNSPEVSAYFFIDQIIENIKPKHYK